MQFVNLMKFIIKLHFDTQPQLRNYNPVLPVVIQNNHNNKHKHSTHSIGVSAVLVFRSVGGIAESLGASWELA